MVLYVCRGDILGRHYEKTNEAIFYKFFDPFFLAKTWVSQKTVITIGSGVKKYVGWCIRIAKSSTDDPILTLFYFFFAFFDQIVAAANAAATTHLSVGNKEVFRNFTAEKWLFWGRPLSLSGSEYTIQRIFLRPIRWR